MDGDLSSKHNQMAISLLGAPRWAEGGAFFPVKGFVLVAALLLAPGKSLTRQEAASLLWEDVGQKRALANLRQLLSRMQQFSEGEPLITSAGTNLSAGPKAYQSDLWFFLSAISAEDLNTRTKAILSVNGELLHSCDTSQEQFYLWLLSERARIKDMFFSSVKQVLDDMTRFGRHKSNDIAAIADRALAMEPDREETYRNVMDAYARLGDVGAYERTSETLNKILRQEARPPEQATLALHRRVRAYLINEDEAPAANNRQRVAKPRVAFTRPSCVDKRPTEPIVQSFVEDVANGLSRYRSFAVLAPHSTFIATVESMHGPESALRADYIVNTTVFPDRRASISLVSGTDGEIIWALEVPLLEDQLPSAFRILSRQVAGAMAENLEQRQMAGARKHVSGAYLHLLAGQQFLRGKCDLPLLRRARSEFRKAVDLDQEMALARGRIAQTLQLEWLMLGGTDPHLLHRAKAEAEASVSIDPVNGIGQWMSAVVALHQRDFDTSAEYFLEAEALAPNSADLLLQHADALAHFGQTTHAWERFERSIDLNPFAPDIYWWAGASIALKRDDYAMAVDLCNRMENDEPALRVLTVSHALKGDIETARQYADRLKENHPGMTARQISMLSPDRNPEINEKLFHAYQLAGIR